MVHSKSKLHLAFTFAVIYLLNSPLSFGATVVPVHPEITEAYYADLDWDQREDDVYLRIEMELGDEYDDDENHRFQAQVKLRLPSGYTFTYYLEDKIPDDEFYINLYFYNHAIESGYYTASITTNLNAQDHFNHYNPYYDVHVFDPPGGMVGSRNMEYTIYT